MDNPMDNASPTIIGVRFSSTQSDGNTTAQIPVFWQPAPGSSMNFLIKLYQDGTEIASKDAIGISGTLITNNVTYVTTSLYEVRVMEKLNGSHGPPSDPVQVIVTAPGGLAIGYDGTTITAQWQSPPGRASTTGGQLILYKGTDIVQSSDGTGITGSLTPGPSLDPTSSYSLAVAATYGVSTGPASLPIAVIQPRATIVKLEYNGGSIQIIALPLPAPSLGASLYSDGALIQTALGPGSLLVFQPTAPLKPWSTYMVQIWAAATDPNQPARIISSGPPSDGVPIVTATPAIQDVSFDDGQTIKVKWQNGPGVETLTGGLIMLLEAGSIKQSAEADGTSGTITPSPPLGPDDQRTLRVASTRWMSNGPSSQDVDVLAARPSVTSLRYDGSILSVGWSAVGGGPAAYVIGVFAGGALLASQISATTSAAVPIALDATLSYSIAVKAFRGNIGGPYGDTQTAISASPTVTLVQSGAGQADVTIAPPANTSGISGYQVQLLQEGVPSGAPVATANMRATINYAFEPAYHYGVIARAVGSDPAQFLGPWSGPAGDGTPVLTNPLANLIARYDKQNVSASWDPVSDPRVDGYLVTLSVTGQQAVTQRVSQPYFKIALPPPGPGLTASLTVACAAGGSYGPTSGPLGVILHEPTINSALFDGSTLYLGWSEVTDAGVSGYLVSILSGGAVTQQASFGGTSGVLSVPPGPFSVSVQATDGQSMGPPSTTIQLYNMAPAILTSGFDADSGSFSMSWGTVPNAGGYSVEVMSGTKTPIKEKTSGTSFSLTPDKFPPAGVYSVRVRPIGSPTSDAIAGPWSAPVTMLLIPPGGVAIEYDGHQARVSWELVASPLVTGYLVTVLGGAAPITAWSATNSVVVPVAFDASKQFNVVVQAVTADGTGWPTAKNPLFQPGFYLSTDKSKSPYMKPATAPTMAEEDIVVFLPEIFTTHVTDGLPTTPPFVFAVSAQAPFAYTMTMARDSVVWTFSADPLRSAVKDAYSKLLADLTPLGLTALGWRVVQDAIARAMPQTFPETLYYSYSFAPDEGYIDLKPGMVLRVEYEAYQYIGPNQSDSLYLNGFVGTNTVEYEIGSYINSDSTWLTGFDAFLSLVTQNGTRVLPPTTSEGKSGGGGGVIDYYFAQFRQPFLRLVYPPQITSPGTTGTPYPAYNVAVLSAPDYTTLGAATMNLRNGDPLVAGAVAVYLRGRAMSSPCIRVWLDGEARVVPVGTTVGNLLESMASRPPVIDQLVLPGLRLTRANGYAITSPTTGSYMAGGGYPIWLDWIGDSAYQAAVDWLSLPLLLGDRLEVNGRLSR
jgi:hypothetical protein